MFALDIRRWFLVTSAVVWVACTDHVPTLPDISAAAGGTGNPTVGATDPDSATQDTTLDVVVVGSGFDQGSQAQWAIAGVPATAIVTNATRFVSSKRLIVTITIAHDADTVLYDVIVTTATGKKGIGTELFRVRAKATDLPIEATYRDAATDGVKSDGAAVATYVDGVDGVSALLLGGGNYRVRTSDSPTRAFCLDFQGHPGAPYAVVCDNGYHTTGAPDVAGGLSAMAIGSSMTTRSQVTWVRDGYNWFLMYGRDCGLNEVPAKRAIVTRTSGDTWVIESPSAPAILCRSATKGRPTTGLVGEFAMPFSVTVRLR